jgi:uncharacterized protein YndB with AHSA1/START domain
MNQMLRLHITVPADPSAVYQAITTPSSLQKWLAEKAQVSLSDGVFELWGRYLPGAPDRPATKLTEANENRSLSFTFNYKKHTLPVSLDLATSNKGTILRVTQEIVERLPGEASFNDFWGLSLENLRRLLLNGSGPLFCDYTAVQPRQVAVKTQINGSPKEVFSGLIDPEQLDRYMADKATVEARPGGKYDFGWGDNGPIKILELETDRKLTYSWHDDTVVSWVLEDSEGGTRITMVHSGFAPDRCTGDYTAGWWKFVNYLKSMVEIGSSWQEVQAGSTSCH